MPSGSANVMRRIPPASSTIAAYDRRPVSLLTVENVTRRFGGIVALDDVSLALDEGTIGGLIGPNGAGKTTLFNVITRLYRPDSGRVTFDGNDLLRTTAPGDPNRNRAHVPERRPVSDDDGGREHPRRRARLHPFGERQGAKLAHETLEYLSLAHLERRPAAELPFGTLKRIELARALVSRPRLLLDEARRRAEPRGSGGAGLPDPAA